MRATRLPIRAFITILALSSAVASSALAAPGIRLSWDHCAADGRVVERTFACDTNAGSELLVGSFVPQGAATLVGEEVVLDVVSSEAAMPAWWQFKNIGACRQTSLQYLVAPSPGPSACVDPFQGNAGGGIGAYSVSYQGPYYMKLKCATALPAASLFELVPDVEYFAFGVWIGHQKTVGSGACSGCASTTCIGLMTLKVVTTDISTDVLYPGGAGTTVTWQGGRASFSVYKTSTGYESDMACLSVTPVRNQTWGAVKALYR